MDKVMFFTDLQMWDSTNQGQSISTSWKKYKRMAPKAKLFLFDLAGHGQAPIRMERDDVFLIAGWSDKVFSVLNAIEEGSSTIKKIMEMEI